MQMDKAYIEEFDVIRRYHQNKLSDEELNGFEVYILENPDIINVLEQEKTIQEAFKEHESLLKADGTERGNVPWIRGLAIAACLVVAVVVVFNDAGNRGDFALQPPVVLQTFRGSDDAIQASGQPVVQFQIDMGPAALIEVNSFNATLVDAAGAIQYTATGLSADDEGWLYFPLTGQESALTGEYEVRIFPASDPGQVTSYRVEFNSP